jgi:hypothetical protein
VPLTVKIQGNRQLHRIERSQALSSSVLNQKFPCKHGFEFDDRQTRDQRSGSGLFDDSIDVIGASLLVKQLSSALVSIKYFATQRSSRRSMTASEREPGMVESARLTSSSEMSS